MRKIIFKISLASIVLGSTFQMISCSDSMLEEDLYTGTSQDEAKQGVQGCKVLTDGIYKYTQYYSYYRGNHWLLATEAGTDEFALNWGFKIDEWGGNQSFLNLSAGHYQPMEMYREVYKIIAQCNEVIVNFGDKASDPQYASMVAEAKFWRAYSYYKLQNAFGAVPLLKGGENLEEGVERTDVNTILSFVETEMKAIETVLPASQTQDNYGRPSKYAVKAFMARYYLNKKDWANASKYAKDVIDNSGATLQTNYHDVFKNDGNSEIILAITHVAQSGKGNKYVALSLDGTLRDALGIKGVAASNGYGMSNYFYSTFATNDKRIAPFDRTTKTGIAIAGVQYKADGVTPIYGTTAAPQTVQKALNRVVVFKFPLQENIPNGEDSDYDFPLMRLGEVYLTYAEAEFQLGNTATALPYINLLRTRAGLTALTSLSVDTILQERGWETYHEGYRREDLLRYSKLLDAVGKKYVYDFGGTYPNASQAWRVLFPIPTDAMTLNPKLTQNTGYN